jgi:signal peptidase I
MNDRNRYTVPLFFQVMRAVLDKNARFRFAASGFSMTPFIRDRDIITLAPAGQKPPEVGDVAAVVHPLTGAVIVHRIVGRQGGGFILKGDNCRLPDGVFEPKQIIGVVCGVMRNERPGWYAGGLEKRVVAFLSRTGLLDRVLLPVIRRLRDIIEKMSVK